MIIMTVGSEEEYVEVGAVLYDPMSARKEFFGGVVMDTEVSKWKDVEGTTRVIHQAELFPILLAARLWSCILANRLVFVFVDNEGAKGSMVNGTSTSRASAQIVDACWTQLSTYGCLGWFDRVPTRSNLADGPSRREFRPVSD